LRVLAVLGRGVVDPETPVVHADDLGLTRGDGCFEGARLVGFDGEPARVDKLDRHLDRLTRSAAALDIPFDRAAWTALVAEAVAAWDSPDEAAMKLVLTRGRAGTGDPTGFITISPLPGDYPRQRGTGVRAITVDRGTTADAFVGRPWLLGGVKTLSYAINMAAEREAARRGADDAIFVAADGSVLESTTGTVLWAREHALHTIPAGASGILAGTTVDRLFEHAAAAGWNTERTAITVPELATADAVWLISSVRGPIEVVELDGQARERRPELDAEVRRLAGFGRA
jgi:4-amino-4-deoxychorismate lyase